MKEMKLLTRIVLLFSLVNMLVMPAMAATGTATSPKDIIGNPIDTFNKLPDSVRSGILMITGIVFLGTLICLGYGIMVAVGKTSIGASSSDAKMRSEGVSSLLVIAGIVLLAIMVLAFVFWWFTPGNI